MILKPCDWLKKKKQKRKSTKIMVTKDNLLKNKVIVKIKILLLEMF